MTLKNLAIHCTVDMNGLIKKKELKVRNRNNDSFSFPVYECPLCKRKYTILKQHKDLVQITVDGIPYINISPGGDKKRISLNHDKPHEIPSHSNCYIYYSNAPHVCEKCGCILEKHIIFSDIHRKHTQKARYCSTCNIYYLSYIAYKSTKSKWLVLNKDDLSAYEDKRKIERQQHRLRKKQNTQKPKPIVPLQPISQQPPLQISSHDNSIRVKDFVVRRTTFKCMNHDHHLQNIDAQIDIIDKFGNIKHEIVSAGYCPNCNIFFIMESTYQKLKLKGTLVCRISDEKTYLNGTASENGMRLAQESILMQYGYNVSQTEDLSSARRKKILAVLVDNDILTKSEIISYLDFFINQRKYQSRFEKAIEKWESDKEFIEDYKNGSYKQYGVKGIFRKY